MTRAGACDGIGNTDGITNGIFIRRAVREKSRVAYSPLIGTWVSGAMPVCLKITPSNTGCQLTARSYFAASASIRSAAK